jgi:hypothetical protein
LSELSGVKGHGRRNQHIIYLGDYPKQTRKEQKADFKKRAKECFSRANEAWKEEYTAFILDYAKSHEAFSPEDTRVEFAKVSKVWTTSERASGGIFLRLVKQKKLRVVGFKASTIYGNQLRTYSLCA